MRFAAGVLLCVVAGACQPQQRASLSVEQAKQITTEFKGQSFVPPPRTITDITAVLDQYTPEAAKIAATRAAADRQPPPDLSGLAAARFYYDRALAARELGRLPQQLADIRRAAEFAPSGTDEASVIRQMLQITERASGNLGKAIQLAEEIARTQPSTTRGLNIVTFTLLAEYSLARGTLDDSDRWLAQARQLYGELEGVPRTQFVRPAWRFFIGRSEADLLLARGHAAEAEARLRAALADLDQALATYDRWPIVGRSQVPRETILAARDGSIAKLARALREQGRSVEAEAEGRRVLTNLLGRVGRYNIQTATALIELTHTIRDQGRVAESEQLARAAIDILVTIDARGSWTLAEAREALASALVAQARWKEALDDDTAMMRELGDDPFSQQHFGGGNLDWAMALIETGRGREAIAMTERVRDSRRKMMGESHYATAEARAVRAMAVAAAGDPGAALPEFRGALPTLLSGAPRSAEESTTAKAQRLHWILDGYIRLLVTIRNSPAEAAAGIDATVEAFRLADAARGQGVQRALAAASARATIADPGLADLARREQDAREQLAALEGVLANALSTPADQQDPRAVETLRGSIDQLREARVTLSHEIGQRFPDYAQLINPQPATIDETRRALKPGEALLAMYVGADATFVWAVPRQGAVAFAKAPLGAKPLADAVRELRRALDPQQPQTLSDIPVFDVALANRLYDALLRPVEPGWQGASSLIVVADGALAQLPLGVLVTASKPLAAARSGEALFAPYKEVAFLARRIALVQLPSVAALSSLRGLPVVVGDRKPFVGFGDPWFSPQQATQVADRAAGETAMRGGGRIRFRSASATAVLDSADLAKLPRLPDTADEVREIARALKADPDKDVFVGPAANEHVVKTMPLADRRVIAFATHGLVPGELNGLAEPALALSAPQVARVDGDGLLSMGEVLSLKLNADWVVLSACNTAAGDGAGAEAVSGLGRAFFYAGARALLVSNWPVETTSARALTTDLFRRQAANPALSRAEALRQAELALIDSDGLIDPETHKVAFSYAHPIFWAPFSLVGDGGGTR